MKYCHCPICTEKEPEEPMPDVLADVKEALAEYSKLDPKPVLIERLDGRLILSERIEGWLRAFVERLEQAEAREEAAFRAGWTDGRVETFGRFADIGAIAAWLAYKEKR